MSCPADARGASGLRRSVLRSSILSYFLAPLCLFQFETSAQPFTLQRTSSPVLHARLEVGITSNYASYQVINNGGDVPDVWVSISGIAPAALIQLGQYEDAAMHIGPMPSGAARNAYFYLTASAYTGVMQAHTINVLNGPPGVGSVLFSATFGLTCETAITASSITIATSGYQPGSPVIGGSVQQSTGGQTGAMSGGTPFIHCSPATSSTWRADIFELVGHTLSLNGVEVMNGGLYFTPPISTDQTYGTTALFRVMSETPVPSFASGKVFCLSGGVKKYNASAIALAPFPPVDVYSTQLSRSIDPIAGTGGSTVTHSLFLSNASSEVSVTLDAMLDTLPLGSSAVVPGSSWLNGTLIPDPVISGSVARWDHLLAVPALGACTLVYDVALPCVPSPYTHHAIALLGGGPYVNTTWFGASPPSSMSIPITAVSTGCPLVLSLKVFLEGPFDPGTGWMHDSLRTKGVLPPSEPYTALGVTQMVNAGVSMQAGVPGISGPNAIVDWLLVELRDGSIPSSIMATLACLVQRDGDVVMTDGVAPVTFAGEPGLYHLAVRHRNHLGAMTASVTTLGPTATAIDFTDPATSTYGTAAQKPIGPVNALWAGNALRDVQLKYAGGNNDRDPILMRIGGSVPTNVISGYFLEDCTLDGRVKYAGGGNDRDRILVNIGASIPTNTRTEQLP